LDHDSLIIGGGPAGLLAASEIASRGHDVLVAEEHDHVGEPDHCAGLLSLTGLERLKLKPPGPVVQNTVSGARIYSPAGHHLTIRRGSREALVVDRRRFDAWLADLASEKGAAIATTTKVRTLTTKPGRSWKAEVDTPSGPVALEVKSVVNAEGARGVISKTLGLPAVPRKNKLPAYQYEMSGADIESDTVEMFYSRKYAPGFFAWIIPLGEGRARFGLASVNKSKVRLEAALKTHPIISKRLSNAVIERGMGGTVLVGLPVPKLSTDMAVTVGDAAGMVKATTGGGVIMGGVTARIAGGVVADVLSRNQGTSRSMSRYDREAKAAVMRELRLMALAQRALSSLSDGGLDTVVRDAETLGLMEIVKQEGDMDLQGRVIERLLRNPRMLLVGLRAIRYINPFMN
jgi:digeranylgeranylglycerophospholipid reductase